MGYPGRQNIYEGTIRRMVTQALEAQEKAFERDHAADTLAQLASYLKLQFLQLGYVPWPGEIVGGSVIEQRFGSWEKALAAAGLPMPRSVYKPGSFRRVKQEELRQKEIYRQRKAEKKVRSEHRKSMQKDKNNKA